MFVDDENLPVRSALENLGGASERNFDLDTASVRQDADDRKMKAVTGYGQIGAKNLYADRSNLRCD